MFTPNHYFKRAAELETMAAGIADPATRTMCLELAQRFRNIANMESVMASQSDSDVIRLAERMVGMTPIVPVSG